MDPKRVRAEGENEAKKNKKQKHGAVVSFYCPTAQSLVEALAKTDVQVAGCASSPGRELTAWADKALPS
jgi:hypothetical protein